MYIPKHFEESNIEVLHQFIRCNPFATLITQSEKGIGADHLPVYLNSENPERFLLQGHIATANPLWTHIQKNQESLVVFQGNNAYITPSWFPSKKLNGRVVPTWNYTAVHVKGGIEFIHEASWKIQLLSNLTTSQEIKFNEPWSIYDAPSEFIENLLPAIVGFEIEIKEIFGKFKLSQNQPQENIDGVIQGLKDQGHEMANHMQKNNT